MEKKKTKKNTAKLERIVKFFPAFDKRDPDPNKNYGIGSMKCLMVLKGKRGAVHFSFSTGMLLPKTIEEYIKDGRAKYELTSYGHYFLNKPMGYDVGYHDTKPHFGGQQKSQKNCPWLDGKSCYCDGSAIRSDDFLQVLIEKGDDEVWKMLEEDYREYFKN